jgi:hypothetical protein
VCHVSLPSSYRSRRGHIHLLRVLPLVGCRSKTPTATPRDGSTTRRVGASSTTRVATRERGLRGIGWMGVDARKVTLKIMYIYIIICNYLWVPHVIGAHRRGVSDAQGWWVVYLCVFLNFQTGPNIKEAISVQYPPNLC